MTEQKRRTPTEAEVWGSLSPKDKFQRVFGSSPEKATPRGIIATLSGRFDGFNVFRQGLSEFGAGASRHDAALRRVGARDYTEYAEKGQMALDALKRGIEAAQKFVVEDLSFIETLARDERSAAGFNVMATVWEPSEISDPTNRKITREQQQILLGEINLKLPN